MERARYFPAESNIVTTAPPIGSLVELSVSTPRTRCAPSGAAANAATIAISAVARALRTTPRELANAVEEAVDFLTTRVAAAAHANEAVGHKAEAVDDGCGVEITVRDEDAAL